MRTWMIAPVGAAVLLLSACQAGGTASTRTPQVTGDVPAAASVARLRQRIDDIWATRDLDLDRAHELLQRQCMRRAGSRIPAEPPATTEPVTGLQPIPLLQRYSEEKLDLGVVDELKNPATRNSMTVSKNTPAESAEPQIEDFDELAYGAHPQYIEFAYSADGGSISFPITGCDGAATQTLYGIPPDDFYRTYWALPRVARVIDESLAAPPVRQAMTAYAACMTSAGLPVSSPADLYDPLERPTTDLLRGRSDLAAVGRMEARVEAADQRCKHTSGFPGAFSSAFVAHAGQDLGQAGAQITRYRDLVRHAAAVSQKARLAVR